MKYLIVSLMILTSSLCYGQMRPLPSVICMADEPDIHNRIPEIVKYDTELLKKIDEYQTNNRHLDLQNTVLKFEISQLQDRMKLEKKIAGVAGLLLFVSGNDSLKNMGLVGLFCWSIW